MSVEYQGTFQEHVVGTLERIEANQASMKETLDRVIPDHEGRIREVVGHQRYQDGRSSIFGIVGGSVAAWFLAHFKIFS